MRVLFEDVSFTYGNSNGTGERVLKKINLSFDEGRKILITGPCGSGKTTLALLLKGLVNPSHGRIYLEDSPLSIRDLQKTIGFSFQFPEDQFFKDTVEEEVKFGPELLGIQNIDEKLRKSIETVGLSFEKIRNRSPYSLSSGEKRRVAIASVFACEPRWFLLDEPTAGLDFEGRERIVELVKLLSEENRTVIIITQELEMFMDVCDEIVVLEEGRLKWKEEIKTFMERDNLQDMEISLPYHVRVFRELRRRGWDIPVSITDPQEAVDIIKEYK